jgi:hypothetical protein
MKKFSAMGLGIAVILCSWMLVQAQERVSMSAPIIRSTGEDLVFTVRFESFADGRAYRLAVAAAGAKAPDVVLELLKGEEPMQLKPAEFLQENTKGWWGVDSIHARGYTLGPAGLPDEIVTFKVTITRDAADQHDKLYLFVSRDYGSGRWYLEDGTELAQSDW